jgi:hypothetical protein
MPRPKVNPEHLFRQNKQPEYWNTPEGCLRLVRIDGDVLIGTRYGQRYQVPLNDCKPTFNKGLWAVSEGQVQDD